MLNVSSQVILSLFYNMCIQIVIISAYKHCFNYIFTFTTLRYLGNGINSGYKGWLNLKLFILQLIFQFIQDKNLYLTSVSDKHEQLCSFIAKVHLNCLQCLDNIYFTFGKLFLYKKSFLYRYLLFQQEWPIYI